jgi:hypothetical protein
MPETNKKVYHRLAHHQEVAQQAKTEAAVLFKL